jgi:signal transduction histidine kinase
MGLRSMSERMETLGGELVVDSEPGNGTRIIARCKTGAKLQGDDGL